MVLRLMWVSLVLAVFLLVLAWALALLFLPGEHFQTTGWSTALDQGRETEALARVELVQDEWRRLTWELGQRPPPVEGHERH